MSSAVNDSQINHRKKLINKSSEFSADIDRKLTFFLNTSDGFLPLRPQIQFWDIFLPDRVLLLKLLSDPALSEVSLRYSNLWTICLLIFLLFLSQNEVALSCHKVRELYFWQLFSRRL